MALSSRSEPFAGVGVADSKREEGETERQHDDVEHENIPMHPGAVRIRMSRCRIEKCHPRHRFSRWRLWRRYRKLIKAGVAHASAQFCDGEVNTQPPGSNSAVVPDKRSADPGPITT